MKITSIQTANFIGARAVDVKLNKTVALFAGKNYAGKSSLQEAVRMALTGESVRVGLKKDYGALLTEGQESGFAEVVVALDGMDSAKYSIVLPSGKGAHFDNAALPYVLDAQRFAKMTENERRTFLFGLMGVKMNGSAITERMLKRGCDPKKVEQIAPFLRAGFDSGQKEAQGKAREAKASWKTVTGGETYGSNKAASFVFEKPEVDTEKLAQARADLAAIEAEIENNTRQLGGYETSAKQAAAQAGRLEELREKAGRFARIQDKLNIEEAELKQWEVKVENARQNAGGGRKSGLVHDLARALFDLLYTGEQCAVRPGEDPKIDAANLALNTYEGEHGSINKYAAYGDLDAKNKLPEYEKSLTVLQNAVANGKRDLAESDAAAKTLAELENGAINGAVDEETINNLKTRIEALKHSKTNQASAIRMLEDAVRRATEADEKTARAAALHVDVQQWEAIGDSLAPDGIPGEMLAEALEPINHRLFTSAGIAEWEQAVIHSDMRITMGLRDYALLSESEKWRTDAMIAEAVSHLSGSRLLVLDRFDVLDLKGREDLLYWLDGMAQDNEIDTALIFGTLKGLPAQLPESIEAFWIEGGTAGQLKQAA